jgi:UrcA family protein
MIRPNSRVSIWQHALLAITSASFAAMLANAPVAAGTASDVAVKVSFSDLDLDHAAGVARLYQRVHNAAKQVCGPDVATGSHLLPRGYQVCVDAALNRAIKQLDRPALTAYHLARTGGRASFARS